MHSPDLPALAQHLRTELQTKKFVLLYAYNGTGKTRLSMDSRTGQEAATSTTRSTSMPSPKTCSYWDNDLENDRERVLKINKDSRFFAGLGELEMDNRIRPLLNRYADFDFRIDTTEWEVSFSREVRRRRQRQSRTSRYRAGRRTSSSGASFSRSCSSCMDGAEAYKWVKYIYIDDPISSLDDNNAMWWRIIWRSC